MEPPPPFDWSQILTKSDLREMEARLCERIERCLHDTLTTQIRWSVGSIVLMTLTNIGANVALVLAVH